MHFVYNLLLLSVALKWGDKKNWRKYYPTILFFILVDLFANFVVVKHPLWIYQETIFGMEILQNHTIINLMIMFVAYPSTILIYIGQFPNKTLHKIFWILLWIFIYTSIEFINLHYLDLINHFNGWTMTWSVLFNVVMFSTLKIHQERPLIAWIICVLWTITLFIVFDIPISQMK